MIVGTANPIEILLVQDSQTEALLIQHIFSKTKLVNRLHTVDDGVKAMAFLRREDPYVDAPRPQLILLDLNLPRMDGRKVLAEIKADNDLMVIPVIVLTSSSAEADVLASYKLHANCYITKPVSFEAFVDIVASIENFWFAAVTLPPH